MNYKVLPTFYNGVQFRSRTEARWAVYFDLERIAWQYEPEGFKLGGVCYLPDFYLPQVRMYAEVKPEGGFGFPELRRCAALVKATGLTCLMLDGPPAARPYLEMFARRPRPGWDVWGNELESSPAAVAVLGQPKQTLPQIFAEAFENGEARNQADRPVAWSWDDTVDPPAWHGDPGVER